MDKERKQRLAKKRPEKKLTKRLKARAGRSRGKITVRRRGGGVKKLYRMLSFGQKIKNEPAQIKAIEYDPYRTADIALVQYESGKKEYRLASEGMEVGGTIMIADKAEIKDGNRTKLKNIPIGTPVYNIELVPDGGGKMVRSAGTMASVMGQEGKNVILKISSGEIRRVSAECFATIGRVSNAKHRFDKDTKAGTSRLKGRRPRVRGTAMPAGPHPHGGGEGKTSIGLRYPKSPTGKIAHGGKTRKRKNTDKYIIKPRKKKKKKK